MPTILFTFRADTSSDERKDFIDKLRHEHGVTAAGQVRPDAPLPRLSRLAFAEAASGADAARTKEWLETAGAVEAIETPPKRVLARG